MGFFQHHVSFQGCISYVFLFELILLPGRSALGIFGPLDVLTTEIGRCGFGMGLVVHQEVNESLKVSVLTTCLGCFKILTGDVS